MGAVALVGVHVALAMLRGGGGADVAIEPEPQAAAAVPAEPTAEQLRERERKAKQEALAKQIEELQSGEALDKETDAMERAAAQKAAAERAAAQQAAAERAKAEAAAEEARRREPKPAPDPKALERARKRVEIRMYSTTWCPACKSARSYMKDHGIAYRELDIDESPSAKATCRRLNPKGSVPTIDVEGEVMVGFSPGHLERLIDDAAQKHVRL